MEVLIIATVCTDPMQGVADIAFYEFEGKASELLHTLLEMSKDYSGFYIVPLKEKDDIILQYLEDTEAWKEFVCAAEEYSPEDEDIEEVLGTKNFIHIHIAHPCNKCIDYIIHYGKLEVFEVEGKENQFIIGWSSTETDYDKDVVRVLLHVCKYISVDEFDEKIQKFDDLKNIDRVLGIEEEEKEVITLCTHKF